MAATPVSRRSRHPLFWPRMKIRGAYRKWLAAQRIEHKLILPHAQMTQEKEGGTYKTTFTAGTEGGHYLVVSYWVDGFGRRVSRPRSM